MCENSLGIDLVWFIWLACSASMIPRAQFFYSPISFYFTSHHTSSTYHPHMPKIKRKKKNSKNTIVKWHMVCWWFPLIPSPPLHCSLLCFIHCNKQLFFLPFYFMVIIWEQWCNGQWCSSRVNKHHHFHFHSHPHHDHHRNQLTICQSSKIKSSFMVYCSHFFYGLASIETTLSMIIIIIIIITIKNMQQVDFVGQIWEDERNKWKEGSINKLEKKKKSKLV